MVPPCSSNIKLILAVDDLNLREDEIKNVIPLPSLPVFTLPPSVDAWPLRYHTLTAHYALLQFFFKFHDLYIKAISNPFSNINEVIKSKRFVSSV